MPRSLSATTPESVGPRWLPKALRLSVGLALVAFSSSFARADIDPLSGIDFVRIGAVGNAPWLGDGTAGDRAVGRGGVSYEFNIGRFEVTTTQWVDFFNAAFDRLGNDQLPHVIPPDHWGAVATTPTVPGGRRWRVPAGNEMLPVGNISWRMAAMYCNWLCNDKRTDRAAFLNGAYDVSTFTYTPAGRYNDQLTHNAGARYWIPTWDEMLKASHFDPNRNGQGQPGWWLYNNSSDQRPIGGPPGVVVNGAPATGNFNWDDTTYPGRDPFAVPLGAYLGVTSPWGLMDLAGATGEWVEEPFYAAPDGQGPTDRYSEGSRWASPSAFADLVRSPGGGDFPSYSGFDVGFRIASSVPAPGCILGVGVFTLCGCNRRRRCERRQSGERSPGA